MAAPRYMLDTNTVSYILRGKSDVARKRLSGLKPGEAICISVITEAEILYGLRKKPMGAAARIAIETFLDAIDVLPWPSAAARSYAELRASCESRGISLGNLDMLIAAHCVAEGAVLVTNDRAFGRVAGLTIQNWTQ